MTEEVGLDLTIDETRVNGDVKPYPLGWRLFIVENATYNPPGAGDAHTYELMLKLIGEPYATDEAGNKIMNEDGSSVECREKVRLTYWMDEQGGKANDRMRGLIRKVGRIKNGEQCMKMPMPNTLLGLMVAAKIVPSKKDSKFVSCYDFAHPSGQWFTWYATQYKAVSQYALIDEEIFLFNADGTAVRPQA